MVNLYQQTAAIFFMGIYREARNGCQSLFAQKGGAGRVAEVVFMRHVAGFSIAKYVQAPASFEFFYRRIISSNDL
ncbi:hypothetical protein BvCmsHHP019_02505 [Escherichia coli]|nr:hypothetical protein BvCmsHHP019_02505 [Escherichia coli]